MRQTVLLCLAMALILAPLGAHAEGMREQRPNLVFGEIGGKAILFSAGYERYFNNRFGLGVGGIAFGAEGGAIGLFPIYASLIPVGDIHSLYPVPGVLPTSRGRATGRRDGPSGSGPSQQAISISLTAASSCDPP